MKIIEITIDSQGNTTVQTRGFAGATCRDASRLIEQALGVVQSDQPTAELYQSITAKETTQQKIGG
jgi:hypothetical protein